MEILAPHPALELLWASPREILNVPQADSVGCHIITVTHEMLAKLAGSDAGSRTSRSTRCACSATTP